MEINWDEVRCPRCEVWEAEQEGSPVAPEPCPACKKTLAKAYNRKDL